MSVLNRRLRVLHGPTNVGNQPYVLSRNERRLGVASQLVVNYDTWLKYPADRVLSDLGNRSRRNVARRGWFAATAPFRADVFHMYFGRSFSCWDDWGEPNRWWFREIALAKRLGRVTVMTLQGCDVRQSDISSERNAVTMCHVGHCAAAEVCRSTLDDRRRAFARDHLPMFDRVLVLNPELAHFVPRADFFPYGNVEIREFTPTPPAVEGPVRIVHAPSDEAIKGSKYIYEAIDALRDQYDIEFTVVKGLPHAEAIRLYAQADLVIDQVLAGWYGGFAVEAMAMGKPVAAFVRDTDLDVVPPAMRAELPIVRVNVETLADDIADAIADRVALRDRGMASRRYVERWHDPARLAAALIDVYRDPTSPIDLDRAG